MFLSLGCYQSKAKEHFFKIAIPHYLSCQNKDKLKKARLLFHCLPVCYQSCLNTLIFILQLANH